MRLSNKKYTIEIIEDNAFKLDYYKDSNLLLDPKKYIDNEFSKIWKLSIHNSTTCKGLILIDSMVASCSCILLEEDLIILLDGYIATLNLSTYKITINDNIENHGCFFAIYEYLAGYIIHGELEIIKLSSDFKIEWSFSGSDIFVRADGTECFRIIDDKIEARCWDGLEVLLDTKGKVIKEFYNK